uniref:Uncharacterized protein n=2 Tax=Hemiselmis andersenii TaxID=464988 RepID=A0A6U2I3G3_HEMAN|eukprot:CAMPEP_0172018016 /NCGR_PEP_ID=MMETSP1041-20130122/11876_1 /TAXON_ID=464988 /ORGANISM="Hemiselmis andersenii, Strain CCMP439" /LENGTH=213 /DNA_ID=CAMNT_0012673091 /DNA_START=40 /DNA_END=681 /DNA_ORIENTATION=+
MPKKKGGGKKKEEGSFFGGLFGGGGGAKADADSPVAEDPPVAADVEPQEVFSTPAQQPESKPAAPDPTPDDKGGEQLNFSTPASTPAKPAEEAPPQDPPQEPAQQQPKKESPSKAKKQEQQAAKKQEPDAVHGSAVKSMHFKPRGGGSGSGSCNVCNSTNDIVIVASQTLKSGAVVPGSSLCQACINKQPTSDDWKEWIKWMDGRKSTAGHAA